jgi:PAS domain S-box-containing protein
MPGIFYLYGADGKFLRWNKNLEIVSGYSGKEVERMHPLDFFNTPDKELILQKIGEVFSTGYAEVSAGFYTKDKRYVSYYFNGRKVNFYGIDYLIGMGVDITDRVKIENALLERTKEIEKLTDHLQKIREEERSRISREIHDILGQQLTALKMDSNWLKKKYADHDTIVAERIDDMVSLIDDTIKTVRRISSELRPGILDDLGLVAALEWQGAEFEKKTGIAVTFSANTPEVDLDRNFCTNIFRIYQEALTNVARHANATKVLCQFRMKDNCIQLVIADNGNGIDLAEVRRKDSLGMLSMQERARLFGGDVLFTNGTPHGTVVTLNAPLIK